jgi:glutathione S-transferase
MKLHWSPRSPYVRKVMVVAHELGLADRFERVRTVAAASKPLPDLMRDNPLSKIPTLVLDDGTAIYDSPVICEYLEHLHGKPKLFPTEAKARLTALRREALGDGMMDFLLLWRGEKMRPAQEQSKALLASYPIKLASTLDALEREVPALEADPLSIGHIAIGVALSYVDFRFAPENRREGHPRLTAWHETFAARPSIRATEHVDDS